ncbi:calcium-binding protein [Aestuariibius sp. 2305UL40-4]|uniref:calcium-binding protein n=1 Tax=Aestuariibius violaceus TaxID=3234132 RepID=UPI00345E9C4C
MIPFFPEPMFLNPTSDSFLFGFFDEFGNFYGTYVSGSDIVYDEEGFPLSGMVSSIEVASWDVSGNTPVPIEGDRPLFSISHPDLTVEELNAFSPTWFFVEFDEDLQQLLGVKDGMIYRAFDPFLSEEIRGSDRDDIIVGASSSEFIDAGAGNDRVFAGDGDDEVLGRDGDNKLFGGEGDDFLSAFDGDDILVGGNGSDRIEVTGGNNIIRGGAGNDFLGGGDGNDFIVGGQDDDRIFARDGDDVLRGGDGADRLFDQNGNDRVFGGKGDDALSSFTLEPVTALGQDDDVLRGGQGNDNLTTASGADRLSGGAGDDILGAFDQGGVALRDMLHGGSGSDTFFFFEDMVVGDVVVSDFDAAEDLIALQLRDDSTAEEQFDLFLAGANQVGRDVVWTDTSGDYTALLRNTDLDELTIDNFIFVGGNDFSGS